MRIAIGSIMQETNTFAPMPTDMEVFAAGYLWRGAELLERYAGMRVEMAGFLDALAAAGATPVPLLSAHAFSGGPVTRAAFDQLISELAERLQAKHHGVVSLITRCQRLGLVKREQSDVDRRAVHVRLTAKGEAAVRRLAELHRDELLAHPLRSPPSPGG